MHVTGTLEAYSFYFFVFPKYKFHIIAEMKTNLVGYEFCNW